MKTLIHIENDESIFKVQIHGNLKMVTASLLDVCERDESFKNSILLAADFLNWTSEHEIHKSNMKGDELTDLLKNVNKQ